MTTSRAVLCLALGETLVWAGLYYQFPALLLRWEEAEAWPKTALTAAFTAAMLMAALVSPVMGRLIDRGHGPAAMAASAICGACLVALLPLAPSLPVFAAIWLLVGLAMGGCLYEPCFALITRTRGMSARRAITLVTLAAGFASTISFPLNHWMTGIAGWHASSWTMAALVGAGGAPLLWLGGHALETAHQRENGLGRFAAAHAPPAGPPPPHAARGLLRRPAFWLLAAGFSLLGLDHGVVINHLLPILDGRGLSPDIAVLAASMIGPMQVAGRVAMMASEHRVSSHAITTASFLAVIAAATCLLGAHLVPALVVPFVVLQGSGYGVTSIMRPVVTREVLGQANFGAISGAMAVPYIGATALSPFIGSLLWGFGGYDFTLAVVAGLSVAGLVAYRAAARLAPSVAP